MTRRLPQVAFVVLVLATAGAFFLVQALKTQPPVLWGPPAPIPAAIDPTPLGRTCLNIHLTPLDYRHSTLTVSVSHNETVGVYIVNANDPAGNNVATVSPGTPMVAAHVPGEHSHVFTWNGRLADGQIAPDGTYYFRLVLQPQDQSINLNKTPVQVITQPPLVRILSVRTVAAPPAAAAGTPAPTGTATVGSTTSTAVAPAAAGTTTTATTTTGGRPRAGAPAPAGPAVIAPPADRVRITFTRGVYRRVWIDVYRTDVSGGPALVDTLPVTRLGRNWTVWDGRIAGAPAPAGTYLVGITAQDMACNRASWPVIPPDPGSTAHAGVSVRYLSVTPPLTPTVSGARASVAVVSAGARVRWRLRLAGRPRVLAHGAAPAGASVLRVRMPRRRAGLYTLTVSAGAQSATVPLVASQAGAAAAHARVLIVLPMLTWMGNTPVDDSGAGLPSTLDAGDAVSLARPLVDGPPASLGEDTALLRYLTARHLSYQLTTDVALAEGAGPSLADRGGVVFPAGEEYLPAGLEPTLRGFVDAGGRVLALGTRTFRGVSHISGFPATPRAGAPRRRAVDPFGARRGPVTPTGGELISALSDGLGVLGGAGSFAGFNQYQQIAAPAPPSGTSPPLSAAGIGSGATAIVAFRHGNGTVIEVALAGFASSLAANADAQDLVGNAWQLLAR